MFIIWFNYSCIVRFVEGKVLRLMASQEKMYASLFLLVFSISLVIVPSIIGTTMSSDEASLKTECQEVVSPELLDTFDDIATEEQSERIVIPFSGFIENKGQAPDNELRYYYSTNAASIGFYDSMIVMRGEDTKLFTLTFLESKEVEPVGILLKTHKVNYFIGESEITDIKTYDEIWYYDLYENIDLRYYMALEGLKYDFVVHPEGNPSEICVKVDDSVNLDIGESTVWISDGSYVFCDDGLESYTTDGESVSSWFRHWDENPNQYGYDIGDYDQSKTLIIDPLWPHFSTYLGGDNQDYPYTIRTDSENNIYLSGVTFSWNFPMVNAMNDTKLANPDAFIAKIAPNGSSIIYSTFLGTMGWDSIYDMEVSSNGTIFATGMASGGGFPVINAYQSSYGGGDGDVIVLVLNSTGNGLIYSTYLGDANQDVAFNIEVDDLDSCYISGWTESSLFPTLSALNSTINGDKDGFVAKFDASGNLIYSTFLGGTLEDNARSLAIDSSGNAYIGGYTASSDLPVKNAFQDTFSGVRDGFVAKLNSTGNGLLYLTYLGDTADDFVKEIALDGSNAVVVGHTESAGFPISSPIQGTHQGEIDGFMVKLSTDGSSMVFGTFIGGPGDDGINDIHIDSAGDIHIGLFSQGGLPTEFGYQTNTTGDRDAYYAKILSDGSDIELATYFGGSANDSAQALHIDSADDIYLAGDTISSDLLTINPIQDSPQGFADCFIVKFDSTPDETPPTITLISPLNESTRFSGTFVTLDIVDSESGVAEALYNWDGNDNRTLNETSPIRLPYSFGSHILRIFVENYAGEWTTRMYVLTTHDTAFLSYSTYLSSVVADVPYDITTDASGSCYLTGETYNTFPITASIIEIPDGSTGIFVTKLDRNGTLVYSTFIDGNNNDRGNGIEVDSSGCAIVVGSSSSFNFPTENAYQPARGGGLDIVLFKLNSTGNGFVFSTYFGGADADYGDCLALGADGNIYVGGRTSSSDFPTHNALQDEYGGISDAFIVCFNPLGTRIYATYYGGSDQEWVNGIAVDNQSYCYVTGFTFSDNLTVFNAYDDTLNGTSDAYIIKLDPSGSSLVFATYLGGTGGDAAAGIVLDGEGGVYVTGTTQSTDYPTKNALQSFNNGSNDIYLTRFNSTGNGILFSTFLGTESSDFASSPSLTSEGYVAMCGYHSDSDLPMIGALDNESLNSEAYIIVIDSSVPEITFSTYLGGSDDDYAALTSIIEVGPFDEFWICGTTFSDDFPLVNAIDDDNSDNNQDVFVSRIVFDFSPPEVLLQNPSNGSYTSSATLVEFNIADYLSGLDSIFYSWDGGSTYSWLAPYELSLPSSEELHNLTVTVEDVVGNSVSRYYQFIVDDTSPSIDSPADVPMDEGTIGLSITWTPSDTNPDSYEILINGSQDISGFWTTSVIYSLDGLAIGVHNFTLIVYDKTGQSTNDTVIVTVIDATSPSIGSPDDFSLEYGTTGTTLTWSSSELHPDYYSISQNDSVVESGEWDGADILISLDGLALGVHVFTVFANDTSGHSSTDTVTIEVVDTTNPEIDSPIDITYLEGVTGATVTWSPSDLNPSTHTIYRDGIIIRTGPWDGLHLTVNVDGLLTGVHNFTLVVEDTSGNSAKDTVLVTVTSDTTTTTTETTDTTTSNTGTTTGLPILGDMMTLFIFLGGSGVALIIVVIVVVSKRKGNA